MKRNAKQRGSGGRLRLGLLVASAAAFLLVPAAVASAAIDSHVEGMGEGSGWIIGTEFSAGEGGIPKIECHWNGETEEATGVCDTEAQVIPPLTFPAFAVKHEADAGSEFLGWEVIPPTAALVCVEGSPAAGSCSASPLFGGGEVTIKATFEPEPEEYALNLTPEGPGSFECDTGSGAEACQAEYVEGTEVTVIPVPDTGAEFVEFGEDCAGATCELTMNSEHNVSAQFAFETFTHSTTVIGEGTVQCSVNAGALETCPSSTTYGDEIEVVATPNSGEYVLAEFSGTGSASGCEAEGSPCTFAVEANSSVTAKFASAEFKDEVTVETVHGEVPETTSLETPAEGEPGSCTDVDLGKFLPGVTDDYTNTCSLTLTSTGAETELNAEDKSATHTGHLVQGSYFLLSALKAKAEDSQGNGTSTGLVDMNEAPGAVTLLEFGVPVAKDASTLEFSQHIDEEEGLHTGEYSKTILLTLEQTA